MRDFFVTSPLNYAHARRREVLLGMIELSKDFIERTKALFGEERYGIFEEALNDAPSVSVRYNVQKYSDAEIVNPVPWATNAEYLDNRPFFTGDPLFHAGCYYVQEASSMFLEQAVKQYVDGPVRALDLCAAPGGKTTHLLSMLPEGSLLVSNEPMPLRAQVLAENVIKWGNPAVVVTRNEPADFASFRNFFDLIVVDAPCSGEGMFRKDDFAVQQWSVPNVNLCAERQKKILSDVWDALRPGGLLVYSTCTFNREEDEDCVEWIADELGADALPVVTNEEWGVTGNLTGGEFPVSRFIPGYTKGEGFFLSLLRKQGDAPLMQLRVQRVQSCTAKVKDAVSQWLETPSKYDFIMQGEEVVAHPKEYTNAIAALRSKLRVLHAALPLVQMKGNKMVPLHSLAMSVSLKKDAFHCVEVEREDALRYLHRESLAFPDEPAGVLLLTYKGTPLGFAKNVGNRANNMYPQEWRIRKNPMEF